jgi:hypothetical protein
MGELFNWCKDNSKTTMQIILNAMTQLHKKTGIRTKLPLYI